MSIPFISIEEVEHKLDWREMADAIFAGHQQGKAKLGDLALEEGKRSMLNRAAWINGLGLALKSVTIFPDNAERTPPIPTIESVVVLFDHDTGSIKALIDGQLVTKWKTASDSILGARLLAPQSPSKLLVIGSGVVATSLIEAYRSEFPMLEEVAVWSRTADNARSLAEKMDCTYCADLAAGVAAADIVTSATMARAPFIKGEWVTTGTHVDLIGAFLPDMREADNTLMQKGELFVDSRETTVHEIGELILPIQEGAIIESDVRADFYDLANGHYKGRQSQDEITVFKNGGGAHLDLMVADLIYQKWSNS